MKFPNKIHIHHPPKTLDAILLSVFVVLVTFQPYFLHGEINIFEVGLYLPGINAILQGLVPFRDFFHLRGPFELYMPALMMKMLGVHLGVLYLYFYIGTVLTLILCVLIAKELLRTRYVFYLMVPVLIARTFPRVVFTFWGGMRYAFGLLAVLFAIKAYKKHSSVFMFFSGIFSMCGFFTSFEIGIYSIMGIVFSLIFALVFKLLDWKNVFRKFLFYCGGLALVGIPYVIYLVAQGALKDYVEAIYVMIVRFRHVINTHLVSTYPQNFSEAFRAMINPLSVNFRHMTPSYFYLVLLGYLVYRIRKRQIDTSDIGIVCLGCYGFIMYNTAFRSIWAAQFEMALQPEKVLFFFILERGYMLFLAKKREWVSYLQSFSFGRTKERVLRFKLGVIYFLFIAFFMSSMGYSLARFDRRFFTYNYVKSKILGKEAPKFRLALDENSRPLTIARAKNIIVPATQADELEVIIPLIQKISLAEDVVFMYPELGTYSFLADRPFLGRFPLATFSWFKEEWHKELIQAMRTVKPQYIVWPKQPPPLWEEVYFGSPGNKEKYDEMMSCIHTDYREFSRTPQSIVFKRMDLR